MLVAKTIKGRLESLTRFKRECLDCEYFGFQWWMIFGIDKGIYSSYKAGKRWKYKKVRYKEYPLPLWSQLTKIEIRQTRISKYWIKIRTKKKRGGIWCPLKLYQKIPEGTKLKDSFLVWNKDKKWYEIRLVFEKEIQIKKSYSNILAIDLGEKVVATVVCGNKETISKPLFLGKEIRGIRRHYSWLRKRLGEKKLLKKIKEIGNKEKNKVNALLQKVSKAIVEFSATSNSVIVLGDLKGIRRSAKGKGRRFNRIVSNMPYYKLTQMIMYKASWKGIRVVKINERGTSYTCSRCGLEGRRLKQGLFKCPNCKYEINADYNGAKNILKRYSDYMFGYGASRFKP